MFDAGPVKRMFLGSGRMTVTVRVVSLVCFSPPPTGVEPKVRPSGKLKIFLISTAAPRTMYAVATRFSPKAAGSKRWLGEGEAELSIAVLSWLYRSIE